MAINTVQVLNCYYNVPLNIYRNNVQKGTDSKTYELVYIYI